MPHIRPEFPVSNKNIVAILSNQENKIAIRKALRDVFPKYKMQEIAIVANAMTATEMRCSDNTLPLEFTIDVGKQGKKNVLCEKWSKRLKKAILKRCPDLAEINFGVWVRSMESNGFSEHEPKKEVE